MNQRGFPLPKEGWTYCPNCDADNMLATETGKRFDCPMCGLALLVIVIPPNNIEALIAKPPLEYEAIARYQVYLAQEAIKRFKAEQAELLAVKMPKRVWLCIKVLNAVAWWFRCECRVIHDKTYDKGKEVQP